MSFRNKILALVTALCLLLLGLAGYLIHGTRRIDNQLGHFLSATSYLVAISSVHSGVTNQTWEVFEQIANIPELSEGDESGRDKHIAEAFDQWQQAILEQQQLGIAGEDEDLALAKEQMQVYQEWLDKLAEIRNLLASEGKEEAFQEFSRVIGGVLGLRLFPGLSRALDDGLLEIRRAETGLTLAVGAFPWQAEKNYRQLMQIKASIGFMLAGNAVCEAFNRQSVALMKYLSSGRQEDLLEFEKQSGGMEQVLEDWSAAAMERLRSDPENPQAPLELTRVRGAMEAYSMILSLSEEAIAAYRAEDAGGELRVILARVGTQVDSNLLPTLAATIQTSKMDLESGTASLRLAGLTFIAFLLVLAMLFALLLLREMLGTLKLLHSGVDRFQAGHLDHRIPLPADAEFARLAHSMNELADRIGQSHRETDLAKRTLTDQVRIHTLQLEETSQERRSLDALVSHDFSGSLAVVLELGEVLLAKARNSGRHGDFEVTQRLVDASREMQSVVKALTSLIQLPHQPLEYEEVCLSSLADEVLESLEKPPRDGDLEVIIQPGMLARGDRNLLWMVLKNLIHRALQVVDPEKPARLEISRENTQRGEVFLVRSRNLDGPSQEAGRMKEAGRGLEAAADDSWNGFYLVRRIVHHLGGETWVEYDSDSSFSGYFMLPAAGDPKREA